VGERDRVDISLVELAVLSAHLSPKVGILRSSSAHFAEARLRTVVSGSSATG
jgi:hypothetical protein